MTTLYNMHTPFVIAFLAFVVLFLVIHIFRGRESGAGGRGAGNRE
jgi:hypothetical protein